jgi:hypothetical protein
MRELDRQTPAAAVELRREGFLDRGNTGNTFGGLGRLGLAGGVDRRGSVVVAQLDECTVSRQAVAHIAMTGTTPSNVLNTLLLSAVVVGVLDGDDRALRTVGGAERRRDVFGDHDSLAFVEIRRRREIVAVLVVVGIEQHRDLVVGRQVAVLRRLDVALHALYLARR